MRSIVIKFILSLGFLFSIGCVTAPDYTNFQQHRPLSIVVLPPLNEDRDLRGTYSYLSTISLPIAERGYYVFPVAVVDKLLRQNGMPTPGEMHQVPLQKVREIIGADAVFYVTLQAYGSKYSIIDSVTKVKASGRLVDTKTGLELWNGRLYADNQGSGNSGGGLVGALVAAAAKQVVNQSTDRAHAMSRKANMVILKDGKGFLPGPYREDSSL